ncbi:MAG TPA: putative zinc-binding metallopeptidase [Caulobacterales bacterium]|nr:putative zinc-binding metallopeptidase [Caulobacterales bacterium]
MAVSRASHPMRRRRPKADRGWDAFSDRELLELRLKDLDLSLAGTWLESCLEELNDDLSARGLKLRAHGWLSDEWFSPSNTPGIAFPFYLAHPRLMRLERKMMHAVEGGTRRECMRIVRHEAGHVIQHAFALHRRRRWQNVFGLSSQPYPTCYRANPASKNYVQHLRRWYAQCHPDEDFAETFAVWLTPRSNWRKRYADWPALKKLDYVDELMAEIAGAKPHLTARVEVDPLRKLNFTLGEHYQRKLEHYAIDTTTSFDRDLKRIFSDDAHAARAPLATAFIQRNRVELRKLAAKWAGEDQITVDAVLDDLVDRCRILKLRAPGSAHHMRHNLAALLTGKAVHSLYNSSRRQWFAV